MVVQNRTSKRIQTRLKEIAAEAEFLPELDARWGEESPVARDVWYTEWRELMSRLEGLERTYRDDTMTAPQRKTYQALRRTLKRHAPLLSKLGLPAPPVPLAD